MNFFDSLISEDPENRCGITGTVLKLIAMAAMLMDHIGAGIIEYQMRAQNRLDADGSITYVLSEQGQNLHTLNEIFRGVGRLAFPIFAFLLVEGFMHTRNVWKYALRLVVFALISEVPFDLCSFHSVWNIEYQNVFFTLAAGLVMMEALRRISLMTLPTFEGKSGQILTEAARFFLSMLALATACVLTEGLESDYGARGIIIICIIYLMRGTRLGRAAATGLSGLVVLAEPVALLSAVPVALYNGKRGLKLKYIFYAFYPFHLLVIWLVRTYCFGL